MTEREALKMALEAQERAWLWMEKQADGQSKGGHATFDLMMLRDERDALRDSITAIREALAQPEHSPNCALLKIPSKDCDCQDQQEPVAITITGKLGNIYSFTGDYSLKKGDKVYTTPPQRKPLTILELQKHWQVAKVLDMTDAEISFPDYVLITKDVEALHGIKENNS